MRCSKDHTMTPVKTKKAALTSQRSSFKGLMKTQKLLLCSSHTATTIDTPDAMYGRSPTSAGTYSNRSAYGSCRTAASNTSITNPPAVVRFVAASVSMFLNLWYAGSAGLGTAILSTAPLVGRSHPFGSTVDSPGHITPASPSPLRLSRRDSPCCGVQNPISLALSPITFTTRNAVTFSSPSTSRNFPPRPSNSVSSSSFSSSGPVLDTRKFAISVGPVPAPTYAGPTGPSRSAAAATAHAASYAHKA
ncbi:hypothetical protein ACMD2_04246 [Ananas comosus]|uniref:Uncharacterized protein n=1 Tax=Ananas comosus TaxID=4615 RepID=A0A199VRZ8_ANACO|nr:hypothetical protein ACMD2_04246 [Ananas comosus]